MTDIRQAAAEAAVPDSEFATPALIAAMREMFLEGWDAAKADVPDRATVRKAIRASVERHCAPHDGYPDMDDLTDSVIALYSTGNPTPVVHWGYEFEADVNESFIVLCTSEKEARRMVADSPTDRGLRKSVNGGEWVQVD